MMKRILVVEDDVAERDALLRLLTGAGHHVAGAGSVNEANQLVGSSGFDVVLLDLHLPGMPGDSLATVLKTQHPRTRIIFMSGEYTMHDPQRFGEHTLYLTKPIAPERLLKIVAEYPAAVVV